MCGDSYRDTTPPDEQKDIDFTPSKTCSIGTLHDDYGGWYFHHT